MQKYTLDAEGKRLGRVATEAAKILMGKNSVSYVRNETPDVQVEIVNASKADIPVSKLGIELKARYSGYPGGITIETVGQVIRSKGYGELFRRAIHGMLPTNKLRAKMMKRLRISE